MRWRYPLAYRLRHHSAQCLRSHSGHCSVWLGNAIVIEAALSFLGLGTPPPTPTWGGMLSGEGRRNLETAPIWPSSRPGD